MLKNQGRNQAKLGTAKFIQQKQLAWDATSRSLTFDPRHHTSGVYCAWTLAATSLNLHFYYSCSESPLTVPRPLPHSIGFKIPGKIAIGLMQLCAHTRAASKLEKEACSHLQLSQWKAGSFPHTELRIQKKLEECSVGELSTIAPY